MKSCVFSKTFQFLLFFALFFSSANATEAKPENIETSVYYVSVFGGILNQQVSSSNPPYQSVSISFLRPTFGAKAGMDLLLLGDMGVLDLGISADYSSFSDSTDVNYNLSTIAVYLQPFLRNAFHTGLYFGPDLGMRFSSNDHLNPDSRHSFALGFFSGYEFYLSPKWSLGPEIHYDHYLSAGNAVSQNLSGSLRPSHYDQSSTFKALLVLNLYL